MSASRTAAALVALVVVLLLMPATAPAASLTLSGSTLEYRAAAGVKDRFHPTYRRNRDFYWAGTDFANISAGGSCSKGTDPDSQTSDGVRPPMIVSCPAAGVRVADVQLGDGDDTMSIQRDEIYRADGEYDDALLPVHRIAVRADGGPGDDFIEAEQFSDTLFGGPGDDNFNAYGGDDLIRAGPGKDGSQGGDGNDRIYGESGADNLFGVGGRDRIYGGAGNDRVNGGGLAFGADRADAIHGGAGDDRLIDFQNGRESAADRFFGGSGNDQIDDRDGNRDLIDCGSGRDRVLADQRDAVAGNCERVQRRFRPSGKR